MEKNITQKLCGKINYNAYNDIQNALRLSCMGLIIVNGFIANNFPILNNSLNAIIWAELAANLVMTGSHGKDYTKDIVQIRELYQEFLKNYNKLNKIFDLNDPIQIYTMFNYLLYKGYLSKDKLFQFSNKQARDIGNLKGTNVIAGKAVCRHISAMLTDILNDYGIESSQLGVYARDFTVNINISDEPKYTKEELIDWVRTHIINEEMYSLVTRFIDELYEECDKNNKGIEISSKMVDDKNLLNKGMGNHAITFSLKDGKSYFLDPTQSRIFRMSETNKNLLFDQEYEAPIRFVTSLLLNGDLKSHLKMKKSLSRQYPSVSKEEEKLMVGETTKLCDENKDLFEKFYSENSELYDDISSKVLKIRKNPFTILK